MKKEFLLVFVILLSQIVSAEIIFEDNFNNFTQDYLCGSEELGHVCPAPPGYNVFKGNLPYPDASKAYGEPDAQIVGAGDRFGGEGQDRGFRKYLEAVPGAPDISTDSQLNCELPAAEAAGV